jgi:hypothetical protein
MPEMPPKANCRGFGIGAGIGRASEGLPIAAAGGPDATRAVVLPRRDWRRGSRTGHVGAVGSCAGGVRGCRKAGCPLARYPYIAWASVTRMS